MTVLFYRLNKFHFINIYSFLGPNIDGDWEQNYVLEATTTKSNVMKVLRAMQLPKPMLLEGSPGVGKTSLISILAKATGHNIVRINLSEQTVSVDHAMQFF